MLVIHTQGAVQLMLLARLIQLTCELLNMLLLFSLNIPGLKAFTGLVVLVIPWMLSSSTYVYVKLEINQHVTGHSLRWWLLQFINLKFAFIDKGGVISASDACIDSLSALTYIDICLIRFVCLLDVTLFKFYIGQFIHGKPEFQDSSAISIFSSAMLSHIYLEIRIAFYVCIRIWLNE